MAYLPDIDDEMKSGSKKLLSVAVANARLKTILGIMCAILILAGIAFYSFYSSIETKVEVRLKEKYDKQIVSLENQIEENTEKHKEELDKQEKNYEEKLSDSDEKHQKEIEKKNNKIEELNAHIRLLEAENKISFDEIETQINTVGKLTTIDYHYTYAGTHEDTVKFFGKLELGITKNSFVAQWDGVVALGVDMSKVSIKANNATKTITVSIPKAEIFYHDVDEGSFEVLDEKNNIFNPISIDDKIKFDIKYEKKIYEKIEENSLLDDAYENAQTMIENILVAVPEIANNYTIGYKMIE